MSNFVEFCWSMLHFVKKAYLCGLPACLLTLSFISKNTWICICNLFIEVKAEPVKQKKKKNINEIIKEKEEKMRLEKLAKMEVSMKGGFWQNSIISIIEKWKIEIFYIMSKKMTSKSRQYLEK